MVTQALQWIADNAQYPAIVTASVSGDYSAALDQAVQTLTEIYGIPVVASAGGCTASDCIEWGCSILHDMCWHCKIAFSCPVCFRDTLHVPWKKIACMELSAYS